MSTSYVTAPSTRRYELRFARFHNLRAGYAFPCDAAGNVELALLSERARSSYLRVCSSVGREFLTPVKCTVASHLPPGGGLQPIHSCDE